MKRVIIASLIMALATVAIAQSKAPAEVTSNPVVSTVRQMEERQSKNLIGAADEMPADKYSYRPTPPQMTFAHLVMHVDRVQQFSVRAHGRRAAARAEAERERFQGDADQSAEGFVRLLRTGRWPRRMIRR